jgi:hypothetical protein
MTQFIFHFSLLICDFFIAVAIRLTPPMANERWKIMENEKWKMQFSPRLCALLSLPKLTRRLARPAFEGTMKRAALGEAEQVCHFANSHLRLPQIAHRQFFAHLIQQLVMGSALFAQTAL